MVLWTYKCYDDGGELNLWQRWYIQNPTYQGSHDGIFDIIEQQTAWTNTIYTKPLGNDLIEVRLSGPRQWRIFGFYGSKRREFVIVATGFHKDQVYEPKDIKKTAVKIIKAIKSGNMEAKDCERPN